MVFLKLTVFCVALAITFANTPNKPGERCVVGVEGGPNACVKDAECKQTDNDKDMECPYGTCTCKDGYYMFDGKCFRSRRNNEECDNREKQCDGSRLFVCPNPPAQRRCICHPLWKLDGQRCVINVTKSFNETCVFDQECVKDYNPVNSGACVNGRCGCEEKHVQYQRRCLVQNFGADCANADNSTEKCKTELHLRCNNDNKCECVPSLPNRRGNLCVKEVKKERRENQACTVGLPRDLIFNDCTGNDLKCRKCSTDNMDNGFCVDLRRYRKNCKDNGAASMYTSFSILLAGIFAYFAF